MIGEIISKIIVWFDNHHTVRKIVKQAVFGGLIAFLTVFVNAQADIIMSVPEYGAVLVVLFAIMNGALNWLKHNK